MDIYSIFDCYDIENNEDLRKAFSIIDFRKKNVLEKSDNTQTHHIIPKSIYKRFGITVDNSRNNLIELTIAEHIKVHYYIFRYLKQKQFKSKIDNLLLSINSYAINRLKYNITSEMSENEINDCADIIEKTIVEHKKIVSEQSKREWRNNYEKMSSAIKRGRTRESVEKQRQSMVKFFNSERGSELKEKMKIYNSEKWNDTERTKRAIEKRKEFYFIHPEKLIERGKRISETLTKDANKLKERNKKVSEALKNYHKKMSNEQRSIINRKISENTIKLVYFILDGTEWKYVGNGDELKKFINSIYHKEIKLKSMMEQIRLAIRDKKMAYGYFWKTEKSY